MSTQDDPYVRVYYRSLSDDKFRGLSAAAWGHWVRLLVIADGMFPTPAPLPRWAEDGPIKELADATIIDLVPGDCYLIHGMEAERGRRKEAATFAADVKHHGLEAAERRRAEREWHAPASDSMRAQPKGALGDASPLLSAPLRSSPSHGPADAFDVMQEVERLVSRPFNFREGHAIHDTLTGDVAAHGAEKMAAEYRAFRAAHPGPLDAAQIVFGVHNALHPLIAPDRQKAEEQRRDQESEAAWQRRVAAQRARNADMRRAMGYDDDPQPEAAA